MRTDARWARPPEYRVLGDPHQVLLRDDQSIDLHRVALRGRLQTYLRAMRGTLWWHVFDLRTLLGSRPLAQELQVQLSTASASDEPGMVFYALRLSFARLDDLIAAIGRVAIVVPIGDQQPACERAERDGA
jgi:hypothetical protein